MSNNKVVILDGRFQPYGELNPLPTSSVESGYESTGNGYEATVAINDVFTGVWEDTLNYNNIIIGISASEDSAVDGLAIQWSHDGTHIDDTDNFTITGGSSKIFTFTPARRFVRVIYTNDGVESHVDLQTIFKKGGIKASSHRIQDSIVADDDAELVKAVLTGKVPGDGFVNVAVTTDGNLAISDNSSGLSIAQGKVSGVSYVSKFGQNEDIGTGAFEDIWDAGGTYTYPANNTAPITHIASSNNGDTVPIEVQGLDINGNLVVQTITLTGTTIAPLTTPLWRIFRMKNVGATNNAGTIIAVNSGVTTTYASIAPGNNQTLMALYTIPAGKTGYMTAQSYSLVGLKRAYSVDGHLWMRSFGGVFQLKHTFGLSSDGTSSFQHIYNIPLKISEKTDIRVSAISSSTGGVMNATFDIVLVDN